VEALNKFSRILFLVFLILLSSCLTKSATAIVPQVQNVVVYNDGVSTFLNVTIYHTPEDTSHFVNTIRVTMGSNNTDLVISPQPLSPQDTFTITYDLGPISGTPTALVEAHCTVNGWSTVNKTIQVPEFSSPAMLLTLAFATSLALVALHKVKPKTRDNT